KRDLSASCCGFATGSDVVGLQRCRLWFFVSAHLRKPLFRRPQLLSAQDEAVVFTVSLPLDSSRKQTRMRVNPVQISIERLEQRISCLFKIGAFLEENPV